MTQPEGRLEPVAATSAIGARSGRHIPALDGVRGIAILLVMLFHFVVGDATTPPNATDSVFLGLVSMGWTGVDLFFVLSGFLITGILLDSRDSSRYLRNFYGRRALRIFPLYFAALIVWLLIAPRFSALVPELRVPPGSAPWVWGHASNVYLTMVQDHAKLPFGTGHFWSLSVEEQFYLVWPFLVWKLSPAALIRVCVGAFALAEGTRAISAFGFGNVIGAYTLMPARADALAAGALIAVLWRRPDGLAPLRTHARALGWLSAATVGLVVIWRGTSTDWLHAYDPVVQTVAYPAIAVLGGLFIVSAITAGPTARTTRVLSSTWLRTLGKYSYGLYVVHVPIAKIVKRLVVPSGDLPAVGGTQLPFQIALIGGLLVLSLAVAWLSYEGFERHFLELKRYFRSDRGDAPAAA